MVAHGQLVGIFTGEYSSLSQCNANCGYGAYDRCSVCDTVHQNVGGGDFLTSTVRKHVQDGSNVPYSALFQNKQCFKRCLKLTEVHDNDRCLAP
jgi:hypothetical protein